MQIDIDRVAGYAGTQVRLVGQSQCALAHAEQKLHLLVEQTGQKCSCRPDADTVAAAQAASTPQSYARVAHRKKEAERWHLSAMQESNPWMVKAPAPFVARGLVWQYRWSNGEQDCRDSILVQHYRTGETPTGSGTPLSDPILFRATSIVAWLKDTHYYDIRQDLSIYHKLDDALPCCTISAVGVSTRYTGNDYVSWSSIAMHTRDWTFLELSPQLHFPK